MTARSVNTYSCFSFSSSSPFDPVPLLVLFRIERSADYTSVDVQCKEKKEKETSALTRARSTQTLTLFNKQVKSDKCEKQKEGSPAKCAGK